ncbi:GNAT family N-acetyltransferase [Paenibacillus polymyxa]|uniref:Acetyltransferase n=1 Tax=Paenibacillus polymyxa TaxID=1406 RepID=A0A378XUR1_PAEPO|nr:MULTISPECIES: GNAT family N-acetyltransferase [Paenibacillus]MEB4781316.1 GNAT family N-acetyltransferase [Paenibacillus jamilae]KAF6657694.1 GNAT family N-acetyltransferase [Paenibacillus sp. EKM301P]MBE7897334.1 GNAT family N-acetyltransferase [Paenibacillus polymyxa]MBG9766374.1 acetyltransferase [Paenibacillus polymyxa]MCC3257417.1 GNAT family N-acetyltransferase [Paenibacillus polymyxa]
MSIEQQPNPILLSFPEQFQTERLTIRAPQWGDGAAVNEAIRESVHELRPWLPFARNLPTVEESEIRSRQARLKFLDRSDMVLYIFDTASGQFVASSGLHRINWDARRFEIGYWLRTSWTGKGIITEAVHGITDFAIQHLHANRLEILCDSRNTRSAKVAERAGFTLEGILRNVEYDEEGNMVHHMVFAKVRGIEF